MKRIGTTSLMLLIITVLFGCNLKKSSSSLVKDSKGSVDIAKKQSISQKLTKNNHLPVKERIALFYRLKKESPNAYNFENEDELTMYGYSLLWGNKVKEAIEIFKLIVSEFPNSSNTYDSLGEAYMANGNNKLAIANYEKSLELNPDNFNAEDQIDRIKHPDRIPETPAEKFANVFTTHEYKDDLDQLGKKLIEVNPSALKFISKNNFLNLIEEKKALITDNTTYGEFIWHCSEIIASINCSHTSIGSFYPESEMLPLSLRFPLQTRWVNDRLFVIDPLNNKNKVALKDEIVSINDIAVSKLVSDIYTHISSQGYVETTKKHFFNTWATGLIPFALKFPATYKVKLNGKAPPIVLNKTETVKDPVNDASINYCGNNLCLEFLDNSKNAVMTISSFNYYPWNNLTFFEEFIDNSFKEIKAKGIENLIIDLRFNGGGSPQSSIHLLRYLVDKPFTYFLGSDEIQTPFENAFEGKLYFMIDGNGKSTTGHFMSLVNVLNLGTIVGEELGSNQFCTAGQTVLRLSNTKLVYYVANSTNETTATSLPDEIGILPDHYVTQSIDDYLNHVDAVKEYTLKLVDK